MRRIAQRMGVAVLLLAVCMLPACSGQEPPDTGPAQPEPVQRPTPPAQPQREEPPAAADWEPAAEGGDTLSIEDINSRGLLRTVYFDYDRAEIRPDQRATLQANAQFLRENSEVRILVGGHCDERGTREYNMALGERRASNTMQYLVSLGVPRSRIDVISYGEEQPATQGSTESAWQQNRRSEFQAIRTN